MIPRAMREAQNVRLPPQCAERFRSALTDIVPPVTRIVRSHALKPAFFTTIL
jgi:hypothetical protein